MKIGISTLRAGVLSGAVLALFAVSAQAQNYYQPFDTADNNNSSSATGFTLGTRNFSPPPMGAAFDFGGFTPQITQSTTFSSTESTITNRPNSGSALLSFSFSSSDGGESSAFTFDLLPFQSTPTVYNDLSFDLMVGAGSTADVFGGYGYFQVATRDQNYGFNNTSFAEELANPSFGSPAVPGTGVWRHIDIPLSGVNTNIRGLTFQDYNDNSPGGRNIDGPEFIFIDNITLTAAPEPASLALLGLAVPAFVIAARRYRKAA